MSKKKLFILAVGTEAAGAAREIATQIKLHPSSELDVMVRSIDTADLRNHYRALHTTEWYHVQINPDYMEDITQQIEEYPQLKKLLFPGMTPATDDSGAGAIRYNGAGVVEVQRDHLRGWLSSSMAVLAKRGDSAALITIAIIISAVGGTGSGAIERLLDVVVDAASSAEIRSTEQSTVIRCDVYILQPGRGANQLTPLGKANALALYTELAASQLSPQEPGQRRYKGRKVMVGWGSDFALTSIEHLKEAAATIVRVSNDPVTNFPAKFIDRLSDNHSLRETDPISHLPNHLSLATVITINTGSLVEQVIQKDTARLIETVTFASAGREPGALLTRLAHMLAGETPNDRYQKLLEFMAEQVGLVLKIARLREIAQTSGVSRPDKISRLQQRYQDFKTQIVQSRQRFEDQAKALTTEIRRDLKQARDAMISQDKLSLTEVRNEFDLLHTTLKNMEDEIRKDIEVKKVDERAVENLSNEAAKALPFNAQQKLDALADKMAKNVRGQLDETARNAAFIVLDDLQRYCARMRLNLDAVLGKLRKEQDRRKEKNTNDSVFVAETGHPLHLMALTGSEEVKDYAEMISIFSARTRTPKLTASPADQLDDFRRWLIKQSAFDALFEGEWEDLAEIARTYTSQHVKEAVNEHKLIDILLDAGKGALDKKLKEAKLKATSMVLFERSYAPGLREGWYVCADYRAALADEEDEGEYPVDTVKRGKIEKAIGEAFANECQLLESRDPGEIAICYYADGLPITAISYMRGECLKALLDQRKKWLDLQKILQQSAQPVSSITHRSQRVGVPVYSGQDAEDRIIETGVLRRLYKVKKPEVGNYNVNDFPELREPTQPSTSQQPAPPPPPATPPPPSAPAWVPVQPTPQPPDSNGHGATPSSPTTAQAPTPPAQNGQPTPPSEPVSRAGTDWSSRTKQTGRVPKRVMHRRLRGQP